MRLVERHIIKQSHKFYKECDELCFKSKNIYNTCLYNIRQKFFEDGTYLNTKLLYPLIKISESYKDLPAKVGNQVILLVDKNYKSFFKLLKKSIKNKFPGYLHKKNGRFLTVYEKGSLSKREFKKSARIKLSKSGIIIDTKITDFENIKQVRIVPRNKQYIIEVVYEKTIRDNFYKNIASIDPGLNNLCTVVNINKSINPFIINGRPLKSMNQFYNKVKSSIQSELKLKNNKNWSNRLTKLTNKRENKINDYLHKQSRKLVNQLVFDKVGTLIIGKNINQKQDINLGKRNNQNFTNIPISRFLEMIKYKAELEGIVVKYQEESYTSKASFIDNDFIPTYNKNDKLAKFSGKRIKRGLYKSKNGIILNADVNGAFNIMKKAIPNMFIDGTEGFAVNPSII